MSLAKRLAEHTTPQRGLPCPISVVLDKLNDTDKAALIEALEVPASSRERISSVSLSKMLAEEGHRVHFKGIERHRNHVCRCG